MFPFKRLSAWFPALVGLCLLMPTARAGGLPFALAAAPGSLLLAGGLRGLLTPDLRALQHIATGAMIGLLLALPIGLVGGVVLGLVTLALSGIAMKRSQRVSSPAPPLRGRLPP